MVLLLSGMCLACGKDHDGPPLSTDFDGRFALIPFPDEGNYELSQVFVFDANGLTQITFHNNNDSLKSGATWLWNSDAILYSVSEVCLCPQLVTVWVAETDGSGVRRKLSGLGITSNVYVSPNEKYIAASYWNTIKIFSLDEYLNTTLIDSLAAAYASPVSWSASAEQLLFMRPNGIGSDLVLHTMSSGESTVLFHIDNDYPKIQDYAVSEDGSKVAFTYEGHIYIVNADGSNPYTLNSDSTGVRLVEWSPNHNQLAYTRSGDDPYKSSIVVHDIVNPTGFILEEVDRLDGNIFQLQWSRDGQQIAFESRGGKKRGIFIIDSNGTDLRHVHDEYVTNFDWHTE